ncbi:MAG: hypothetical protein CMJ74_10890 [Planctomycetaceae bacterium]|nr:hypothetical protein [Planctomycetaceae bacterium]|tara:strand:- start:1019 stop:1492 length:474 start_codon:yes stop_codon:yes gene_type:complete
MIISKEFKFYAAHRNEEIGGKCANLHGHRYGIICKFEVERVNSVSTPFAEFDDHVGRLIAEQYDHGMLIHRGDSLYSTLKRHEREFNEEFKMKILDGPTSVENLAHMLFTEITELGFRLVQLEVKETDTSVVEYTLEDWQKTNNDCLSEAKTMPRYA